jgi:CheY-like chemotaxis protein
MGSLKNIFIIDDDKLFIFLTRKTIELTNYVTTISEFGDGLVAINHLRQISDRAELLPDIIFLDLSMPVMDGWEFLEEYSSHASYFKKKIKLYIFSSSISPHDIERAKNFSVVADFIIKPLVKEKIIELLKSQE